MQKIIDFKDNFIEIDNQYDKRFKNMKGEDKRRG